MPRTSAGLLMYRIRDGELQVLLAHTGGPLFKSKEDGAWTIPKGEVNPSEDLRQKCPCDLVAIGNEQCSIQAVCKDLLARLYSKRVAGNANAGRYGEAADFEMAKKFGAK